MHRQTTSDSSAWYPFFIFLALDGKTNYRSIENIMRYLSYYEVTRFNIFTMYLPLAVTISFSEIEDIKISCAYLISGI